MSIRVGFSRMAVAVVLSAIVPSAADAASLRKNRCCPPAKCQTTAACAEPCATVCETALCEMASGVAARPEGSYSAFTGVDGTLYGLNTATGQVYKFADGDWHEFEKSIP